VRRKRPGRPRGPSVPWLANYRAEPPGTDVGDNAPAQLDPDNDPQPDSYLLILPECGGQCRFTDDDYISGGPEFIGEIAASSASRDLHQKFHVYRRNGVREYVVWKTMENEIVWFRLQNDVYVEVEPENGILKSSVFPGLWLDAAAMIRGDLKSALATLAEGIATPEHAAFVKQLESQRTTAD